MSGYDYERPFIAQENLQLYSDADANEAANHGASETVRAGQLTNIEYKTRFGRLAQQNRMKPPPGCGRIFMGYLVVRNLGTSRQYETWMPDHVFEDTFFAVQPSK